MNKQEFIKLYEKKDEISVRRVNNILDQFIENTQDSEVIHCIDLMEALNDVEAYLTALDEISERKYEGPHLIEDGFQSLQARILQIFIESLEE